MQVSVEESWVSEDEGDQLAVMDWEGHMGELQGNSSPALVRSIPQRHPG